MADTNITADPIVIATVQYGTPIFGIPFVRDPELDITFYCDDEDELGVPKGIIRLTTVPLGDYLNLTIWPEAIEVTTTQEGSFIESVFISSGLLEVEIIFSSEIDVLTELFKKNWVKWSNIGYLDFTIWKDNVAGERPLDWKGWVYEIKKLKRNVIVYGENGISLLVPADNTYGLNTIYRLGLKGKQAVAGDESIHFFIDKEGTLWSISESLEKLGYSEYLDSLSNPVLSWDLNNRLLYICDGTLGFIYSPDSKSLGKGPNNITGIGYQGGASYIAAPIAISTPTLELWTDIYDIGVRKGKSIESLEFGVDLTTALKG
jgi:hypothetical protein